MRLRSITLTNVRRFAGTSVTLDGIGDGLTVVTAPNEAGKSTVFEALQALLFAGARSASAEVRALQPWSGGAPEVAAEVEVGSARFRVAKRWLARPFARVEEAATGRIVAQDDAAEAWIRARLTGEVGGPAALLWVRQGSFGLEPEGPSASDRGRREDLLRARRDLVASVAGEVEAITGGRRLDVIQARAAAALAEIATATGRPKAGGPWREAEDEAAALRGELAVLDGHCAALAEALERRGAVVARLGEVADPRAVAGREGAVVAARSARERARMQAFELDAARSGAARAEGERVEAARALAEHARCGERVDVAAASAAAARDRLAAAEAARAVAEAGAAETAAALGAAGEAAEAAVAGRVAAERAARARVAADRLAALGARVARAAALTGEAAPAEAEAEATGATDAGLAEAEAASAAIGRARARLEAGAVALSVVYAPGAEGRVVVDGRPLVGDAAVRVTGRTVLDLAGIGRLTVEPGGDAATAAAALAEAEARLAAALAPTGAVDAGALRVLVERRGAARQRALAARAELAGLAPDGIEALRAGMADLEAEAEGAPAEAPDTAAAVETERAAGEVLARARQAAADAALARAAAERDAGFAAERLGEAERRLAEAAAEAAGLAPRETLVAAEAAAARAAAAAGARVVALGTAAADVAAAEAALAAAEAAVAAAERERRALEGEERDLAATIRIRAEEGVEERRGEVAGRLEQAAARAAGFVAEARALARLGAALATARAEARDRYLAPVEAELRPLVAGVITGADLRLDAGLVLPDALLRDGRAEAIASLSGGTREQVAILTRLAFARLLARAGRATPVVLDDALVFADDDRLARMGAAIAEVAADVQVIVLTCRERAFAGLTAARPRLGAEATPAELAAE